MKVVFLLDYIYMNLNISSMLLGIIPLYGSPTLYLKPSMV